MTLSEIKTILRNGPYAWPGGYPIYFVAVDGQSLSFAAVRANWREIVRAHITRDWVNDWRIYAAEINWEDDNLYCADSGAKIESAYGSES